MSTFQSLENSLKRMKYGEQRQKIVAETGISQRTLERIFANEIKIRESPTDIDTSKKGQTDMERMLKRNTLLASGSQIVYNCYFG